MTATHESTGSSISLDDHEERSRRAQRRADLWMVPGACMMGTLILGIPGLIMFLWGIRITIKAQRDGLTTRPLIVTLIGYLVAIDAALNTFGWALDFIGNRTLLDRTILVAWGNMFDAGYFWHYNELGTLGGASAPGEKSYVIALLPIVFCMRLAAAIGFLQMKRWGHQWLIVTCWFGVIAWGGYIANMTIFADLRYDGVVLPVIGWWLYDIFYITPFLALPYLHSVNREIFTD